MNFARTWTTTVLDTVGRDDRLGAGRSERSSRLAELKADGRSEFASRRPLPVAGCPQSLFGLLYSFRPHLPKLV